MRYGRPKKRFRATPKRRIPWERANRGLRQKCLAEASTIRTQARIEGRQITNDDALYSACAVFGVRPPERTQ